jgi:hypothetical protein
LTSLQAAGTSVAGSIEEILKGTQRMNRLKNFALMAAGFGILAAVVSGITAAPAIAQLVKAALVKNVDERGRTPYSATVSTCTNFSNLCGTSSGSPAVPAGKRLVVTHINTQIVTSAGVSVSSVQLYFVNSAAAATPITYLSPTHVGTGAGVSNYVANQDVLVYVEAGFQPNVLFNVFGSGVSADAFITGYLVDLTI